jgi:hypothetical protein
MNFRTSPAAQVDIQVPDLTYTTTGTWVWSNPLPVPAGQTTGHIYQDSDANCCPASFINQLWTVWAGNSYTQDQLAQLMGTTSTGTSWANAVTAMNKIVAPNYVYTIRIMTSGADILAELEYQIAQFGAAMVAPTVEGLLPWVNNPSNTNGHDIVVYGYNTTQNAVYCWDPYPGRGYEWITVTDLYNALQFNNSSTTVKAMYAFAEEL